MRRLIMVLAAVLIFSAIGSAQTTWYVPDDFSKIQDAISNASVIDGDTIIVRPGTYVENIDFLGKAIALKSKHGPEITIIDGGNPSDPDYGSTVIFQNGENSSSKLQGFTITNGSGTYTPWKDYSGGGIFCYYSSPIIMNNIIKNNIAERGSGICCENSLSIIVNNIIIENSAVYNGGGIHCGASSPSIINNTIYGNAGGLGGGGFCGYQSSPTFVNSILWDNNATLGSEIFLGGVNPYTFKISFSDVKGGKNKAYVEPAVTCIWGFGMIDANPLFVDPINHDFHLTFASPCIDIGDNNAPSIPIIDFEGDPRVVQGLAPGCGRMIHQVCSPPQSGIVDMGADEYCVIKHHGLK